MRPFDPRGFFYCLTWLHRHVSCNKSAKPAPGQNEWFSRWQGVNGSREQSPSGLRPGSPPAAAFGVRQPGPVFALLLLLALAAVALPALPAAALALPWQRPTTENRPAALSRGLTSLQEVSPPAAVQQLQSALSGRQPVVDILSPQEDATLPPGPWTLKLRVHDWPLVDGGDLGPGPHLVVQLDQEPPQIWTRSEGEMPELTPGSHRLTVYAAQPWGEARKNPGAVRQIRLHRTAANPLSLPAPGSPQLLAVSPSGATGEEPLLLDWLLLDAPLQDVGGSGTQWRLRVSINDDAVLLDQQTPLWLRGWRPGRNALRLELLDARGEPLNPPFNSLVREVNVDHAEPTPRWGGPQLSASELAILVGEAPAAPPRERPPTEAGATPSSPDISGDSETGSPSPAKADPSTSLAAMPATEAETAPPSSAMDPLPASTPNTEPADRALRAVAGDPADPSDERSRPSAQQEPVATPAGPEPASEQEERTFEPGERGEHKPTDSATAIGKEQPAADTRSASDTAPAEQDAMAPEEPGSDSGAPVSANPQDTMTAASSTAPPPAPAPTPDAAEPIPPPANDMAPPTESSPADRIRPSSTLAGRARDLVNDDGTLRRPEQRGPLAGLRDWLQR